MGPGSEQPKLAEKRFYNVSMIMTWNTQKDRVNKLGTIQFAEETGQDLRAFYSCDTWAEYESPSDKKKGGDVRKK